MNKSLKTYEYTRFVRFPIKKKAKFRRQAKNCLKHAEKKGFVDEIPSSTLFRHAVDESTQKTKMISPKFFKKLFYERKNPRRKFHFAKHAGTRSPSNKKHGEIRWHQKNTRCIIIITTFRQSFRFRQKKKREIACIFRAMEFYFRPTLARSCCSWW